MTNNPKNFFETAKSLAKNPLGIIALFIALVYGFACLVTAFASSFTATERLPLVYFLVLFPIIVLGVFAWLVSNHSNKLFAPSDFKNEENYMKMQITAVASLATASAKAQAPAGEANIKRMVEVVREVPDPSSGSNDGWRRRILWVDDRPENNVYERQAFEAFGLQFTLALSTDEAFRLLAHDRFVAIISDMGRKEGPREGYVLLDRLRRQGDKTPLFFYIAASNAPEHKLETTEHGGQGCTNNAQDLFEMVMRAVMGRLPA